MSWLVVVLPCGPPRRISLTDPLNHQTNLTYNAAGKSVTLTDSFQHTTQLRYSVGDLTTITDPLGRLTQVVDSLSGTMTRTYDTLDRLTSETTAQGSVSYTYDNASRRATMTVLGQATINYSYDNADFGNLIWPTLAIRNGPPFVTGKPVTLFPLLKREGMEMEGPDGKESQSGVIRADATGIRIWSKDHQRGGQEVWGASTDGKASDWTGAPPGAEETDAGASERVH